MHYSVWFERPEGRVQCGRVADVGFQQWSPAHEVFVS